jgi:outer membrane protein
MKMTAKLTVLLAIVALATVAPLQASIGVVDMRRCLDDSKFGQHEKDALLALQKKLGKELETAERELTDLADKLQDPEYVDSLSPQKDEELKMRYQMLSQEIMQKQNQFYQILGQGEMKLMQELTAQVMRASQIVAKDKKMDFVIREEALTFFTPSTDITKEIVTEMDKLYANEMGEASKNE